MPTIGLTIDGKGISTEPGKTVLEAALEGVSTFLTFATTQTCGPWALAVSALWKWKG